MKHLCFVTPNSLQVKKGYTKISQDAHLLWSWSSADGFYIFSYIQRIQKKVWQIQTYKLRQTTIFIYTNDSIFFVKKFSISN